jgi:hypothetical protein
MIPALAMKMSRRGEDAMNLSAAARMLSREAWSHSRNVMRSEDPSASGVEQMVMRDLADSTLRPVK